VSRCKLGVWGQCHDPPLPHTHTRPTVSKHVDNFTQTGNQNLIELIGSFKVIHLEITEKPLRDCVSRTYTVSELEHVLCVPDPTLCMNETLYSWTFIFHEVVRQQNGRSGSTGTPPKLGWNRGRVSSTKKPAISPKRCKIGGPRLLWRTNRNSHTRFRLAPKSMTLDDLERPKRHKIYGARHKKFNALSHKM